MSEITKKQFATTLIEIIKDSGYEGNLEVTEVIKNNGIVLTGIRETTKKVSPNVYVDEAYEQYMDGSEDLYTLADRILSILNKPTPVFDDDNLNTYDKDSIGVRLINKEANEDYLADKPHRYLADLAIVYERKLNDQMSFVVTNGIAKRWGVTELDLYADAINNLNSQNAVIMPIDQMIDAMLGRQSGIQSSGTMVVIGMSDINGQPAAYGASVLLRTDILDKVSSEYFRGEDFYIIPSSTEEIIAIDADASTIAKVSAKIAEVNAIAVAPDQILSDALYSYNRQTGSVEVIEFIAPNRVAA